MAHNLRWMYEGCPLEGYGKPPPPPFVKDWKSEDHRRAKIHKGAKAFMAYYRKECRVNEHGR